MNRFVFLGRVGAGLLLGTAVLVASLVSCSSNTTNNRTTDNHAGTGGSGGGAAGGSGAGGGSGSGGSATGGSPTDGGTPSDTGTTPLDGGVDAGGPATLAGHLSASALLFVDSDTGDSSRPATPNDDSTTAQAIASPSLVGGYLGATKLGTDQIDVYAVEMGAGDVATLHIGVPGSGAPLPDFDLGLFDPTATLVDSSTGTTAIETVTAAVAGSYFVAVQAAAAGVDAGLYVLTVGAKAGTLATAARGKLNAAWPFVAGEALVKLRPQTAARESVFEDLGVTPLGTSQNAIGYSRVALHAPGKSLAIGSTALDATGTIAAIKRLQRSPAVLYAEPNYIRKATAVAPNDRLFPFQWHYQDISLLDAWDHSKGASTTVAVLDTGVKKAHPDFVNADASSQLLAGYDMIADPRIAGDGNGRDSNSDDPGDQELVTESSWHGTHVSGTIAAATNNTIGCAGVAPQAKILPVRVLGIGGGTVDDIVQGMLYAAGLGNDAGVLPAKAADVINMSLGGPGLSQVTADAVALARGAGVVVVAASGNDGKDATFYSPAGETGVVAVSATDIGEKRASYSNYGSVIAVAAPGGDESTDSNADGVPDGVVSLVYANSGQNLYTPYEGTSMAAPHVAGVVALMKAAYPGLTPPAFDSMLAGTAGFGPITQDLGPAGRDDDYGYGLINANLAVLTALDAASNPATSAPSIRLSNATLDFGQTETSLDLDITNVGRGTLTVSSVTADQSWVTVTPGDLGANTVTVDRGSLPSGIYTATITVVSNGGTATVTVRMTVPSSTVVTGGNIGVVYVILVDPATNASVASFDASPKDGYSFQFDGVPPGDYLLAAGTDLDENGFINDEGEAFGMYPVTSAPQTIHVGPDQTTLSFPIRFQFGVQAQGHWTGTGTAPRGAPFRIAIPRRG